MPANSMWPFARMRHDQSGGAFTPSRWSVQVKGLVERPLGSKRGLSVKGVIRERRVGYNQLITGMISIVGNIGLLLLRIV